MIPIMDGTGIDVSDALTTVTSVFTSAMSIITGNPVLMVFFAAGLLGVGFRLVRKARKAVAQSTVITP